MDEPAQPPALRASDADRERTVELLRAAASEGRLDVDELDERAKAAYASRTRGELQLLVADVVVPDDGAGWLPAMPSAPAAGTRPARLQVRPGEGGVGWLLAIMSGSDRTGHWRLGARCRVVNVMGGSSLDLNDVELASEQTEITVFSLMGGSDLRIPEGLNVEISELGIMGGNDIRVGDSRPDPGGPVLKLNLIAIMGGNTVKRGRRVSRRERREQAKRRPDLPHGAGHLHHPHDPRA